MKKLFLYGLFVFSLSASAWAVNSTVPASWYQLPEDQAIVQGSPHAPLAAKAEESTDGLNQQLDIIFRAQANALEKMSPAQNSVLASDFVPWRFVSFMGDLSISAKGLIGLLTWKGQPGVSVYWMKKEKAAARTMNVSEVEESDAASSLVLTSESTKGDLDQAIEGSIRAVMASRHVDNEPEFRKNFRAAVEDFVDLSQRVSAAAPASAGWEASRVRVDLSVEGTGSVSFAALAGASVRVRLEWFKVAGKKSLLAVPRRTRWSDSSGLESLMTVLSQDVAQVAERSEMPADFFVKTFRVGLGVSVGGTIGVVKSSAKAVAHVYFTAKPKSAVLTALSESTESDETPVYLLESAPKPERIAFAKANNLLANAVELAANPQAEAVYKINRRNFRQGLRSAVKMGSFFASSAGRSQTATWKTKSVKTNFELSAAGTSGLATITGLATGEITFENKNF